MVRSQRPAVTSHHMLLTSRPTRCRTSSGLRQLEAEYESARQGMDFNRVRELADERKYLEVELQARKADQVEGGKA